MQAPSYFFLIFSQILFAYVANLLYLCRGFIFIVVMKRFLFILVLLCGTIMSTFSEEYYRIDTRKAHAYSRPSAFLPERTYTYKYNDVVIIDAFQQDGIYVFVRVANSNPERWLYYDDVVPMTPEEIKTYKREGTLSAGYPWAHFNPQLARMPYYTVLYWITLIMAICSIVLFVLLYKEAKSRDGIFRHYLYGICALALLFWVFHFGTWQCLQIGVLCAALLYPLSFTRLLDEPIMYKILVSVVTIACLVLSWMFLRQWERTAMTVGFFSWLAVVILTFVNIAITYIGLFPLETDD